MQNGKRNTIQGDDRMNGTPVIIFRHKGDLKKTDTFLRKMLRRDSMSILNKYGKIGVDRLLQYTPKDTGETALSWGYRIEKKGHEYKLIWTNSNISDGFPVAILIQYGHGTTGGTYVEGRDFINPALKDVFDELAEELWKEVTNA